MQDENLPKYTLDPRPPRFPRPSFWMISGGLILLVGSWVPLALFARARAASSDEPRVSFVQDMGIQPKYREQQSSEVFADGRADRPRVEGTVARGQLHDDDFFYRGYSKTGAADEKGEIKFFDGFPQQVKVTPELLARGQERFNIYCSACHGRDGYGHGPVNERATELQNNSDTTVGAGTKWTQAANLHDAGPRGRQNGHIFNTITNGIRSMPGYGTQIAPADRWAIVAYVRALQVSQDAPAGQAAK